MLVIAGTWLRGLDEEQIAFVRAIRPGLAYLVAAHLDKERQSRQRAQLGALAKVADAFIQETKTDHVLNAIATAAAKASGHGAVTITVYNEDGSVEKGRNLSRRSPIREELHRKAEGPTPIERDEASEAVRALLRQNVPVIRRDVFAPEIVPDADLRDYYASLHLRSSAIFPLIFQERLVGSIRLSSPVTRSFPPEEVEFLTALASQVASSVIGLRLFRELEKSRAELREYATRLEEASEAEHFLARTDALTGIPNRRYAEEVLRAERARMERYGTPVSVVIVDIDYFKRINDTRGHQSGDEVLKHFANLARELCRVNDFVARWGGDEFVVILPQTSHRDAEAFADRLRLSVEHAEFHCLEGAPPEKVTISAGVAQSEVDPADTADLLLDRADKALYDAKKQGRNSVVCARIRSAAA
jgi:diguanylate cyclase (GGDEF)-like protein